MINFIQHHLRQIFHYFQILKLYEGVPRAVVQYFVCICPVCQQSSSQTNVAPLKQILASGFIVGSGALGGDDVLFINGRPRHSQSQGLVEKGNYSIERQMNKRRAQHGLDEAAAVPWAS